MGSLIHIVNEDDEIIGHKERAEIDPAMDIYRAAGLWLTNSKGEILISERSLLKRQDAGKWGPGIAGTVEKDETYETNIVKEAEEELGIRGLAVEWGPKERVSQHWNYFCQYFFATVDLPPEDFVLQEEEVTSVAWISEEDLMRELNELPDKFIPAFYERKKGNFPRKAE